MVSATASAGITITALPDGILPETSRNLENWIQTTKSLGGNLIEQRFL